MSDRQVAWTENRADGRALVPWRELWGARELLAFFALRDLRVRYKQAALGVVWVIAQPVFTVAAFTLAFDRLADVDTRGVPYPVFAIAGLLTWTYFSQCVGRGSEVLVSNPALVTKVYIPRLVAPLASLIPPLVDLAVGLVALVAMCIFWSVAPTLAVLLFPLWLASVVVAAAGPVLVLAALNVRFRDVRHVVPPLLQIMLFVSPVAYPATSLRGLTRFVYALNPAVGPVELARYVLIGGEPPGPSIVVSFVSAVCLAVAGLVYFQSAQRHFADVI